MRFHVMASRNTGVPNVDPQPRGTRLLRVKIGHDNCIAHE